MKLLLLGATGRTGKLILTSALAEGYKVNCLVRDADKLPEKHEKLTVFEGTPARLDDLKPALAGCTAVISALNISRKSDFPWSKLRTPEKFLSEVMGNLLQLAKDGPQLRIVVCSAWGVSETKKDLPGWFRWFIDHSNIGVAYRDHERQEAALMATEHAWTLVRPVGLTNTKKPQAVRESYDNRPRPRLTIGRLAVARYMVAALKNPDLVGKAPVISAG